MAGGGLVRTLRVKTRRKVGNLGLVTTALGDAGAQIGEITTFRIGHNFTVRDFQIRIDDPEHAKGAVDAVDALAESEVVDVLNEVELVHLGGKVRTRSRVDISTMPRLLTAYNPGVREIIQRIDANPDDALTFTSVQRTVALVTDGSGLLGMGRVRSRAMLPVLEAKAALLATQTGLNSLPLVLDVQTEDDFVATVKSLTPSCGAILLDAIGAPRGLRVHQKLSDALDVPVFDDDSDGPAITILAATLNAVKRCGLDMTRVSIGQIGLGTAGGAIARLIMKYTGRPVLGEDVHPGAMSRHVHNGGKESSLDEIMTTCDVVIANTGHGGVISPRLVREGQIILALSDPHPEIDPYDATLAGAAFAADGHALNKAVAFLGTLLGALAVNASRIDDKMRIAAAQALAEGASDTDLVPTPLEIEVHAAVASAVAKAAIESGAARITPSVELSAESMLQVIRDERQLPLGTTTTR
jgi:malate dehydrogenase (oxaloacetate-decarboxylating)